MTDHPRVELETEELPVEPATPEEAALTLTQAAELCHVNRRTLTRALDAGRFPRAYRSDGPTGPGMGPWLVPWGDLKAAGFRPDKPEQVQELFTVERPTVPATVTVPATAMEQLRAEVMEERHKREMAEVERDAARAIAEERAAALADARLALHALTAGPPAPIVTPPAAPAPVTETGATPAPKRWWRRS